MGEKSLTFAVDDVPSQLHCEDDELIKTTNMNDGAHCHNFCLKNTTKGKKVRISVQRTE